MKLTIRVWRQPSSDRAGFFEEHVLEGADAKMSVLELLDALAAVGAGARPGRLRVGLP